MESTTRRDNGRRFVAALRKTMRSDLCRCERAIDRAMECGDDRRLVRACSRYYHCLRGFLLVRGLPDWGLRLPPSDYFDDEQRALAYCLGQYLHETYTADPAIVARYVERLFEYEDPTAQFQESDS